MALEHLRILTETAAAYRAFPASSAARRRRNEAVKLAARNHSVEEIAEAAELPVAKVIRLLRPTVADGNKAKQGLNLTRIKLRLRNLAA